MVNITNFEIPGLIYGDLPYKNNTISTNNEAVRQSILLLFDVIKGELLNYPDFGSNLRQFLFSPLTTSNSLNVLSEIKDIIKNYEPRVTVLSSSTVNIEDRGYTIELDLEINKSGEVIHISQYLGDSAPKALHPAKGNAIPLRKA